MQWSMVLSLCEYYWWGEASPFEAHDVFRRFQQICMRSGFAFCVSWFFCLGAIVVFCYASLLTRLPIRTFTIQLPWLVPQVPKQRQQKQSLHPRWFANHMCQSTGNLSTPFPGLFVRKQKHQGPVRFLCSVSSLACRGHMLRIRTFPRINQRVWYCVQFHVTASAFRGQQL